ncbi:methyl-accepting chemotaxis protein [Vibrio plantisponsor]|uniref:Methyl-accepting chemotaxis protein n=1 Tax=Vibrio plantisponsor TaxID=664643 RepID=A0ABU4INE0_9VIBR|nr:methyl-accepting chemotaxis protein [Vibrio plantisponsor]MDW6019337.1 methyl-accepting chemotaxis protein [Vibrio plantisponsor]NNM39335.1 methyl-accepting chemotaxis protein [Vibrio plantisponsor]
MNWLGNLTITKKLIGLIVTLLALTLIVSSYAVIKMERVAKEIEGIAHENLPLVKLASNITIKQLEGAVLLEKAFRLAEIPSGENQQAMAKFVSQVRQSSTYFDEEIVNAKSLLIEAKKQAVTSKQVNHLTQLTSNLAQLEEHHKGYEKTLFSILDALEEKQNSEAMASVVHQFEQSQQLLNKELANFLVGLENATENAVLVTEEEEHEALIGMATLSIASIIFGLTVGILFSRRIVSSMSRARNVAASMAQGNFDQMIEVKSNDEIGQLMSSMNVMASSLSKMIGEVMSRTDAIAATVTQLSAVAESNRQAMQVQQENTEQVASAMTEMAATITEVASNADSAAFATSRAETNVKEGCSTIDMTQELSAMLVEQASQSQNMILDLKNSTQKIQDFVKVVDGISEQTNLLALNAAIESARAGEQGRGFAVVADEVRALASRSQQATNEIGNLIEMLVKSSDHAHNAMNQSNEKVHQTSECIQQARNQLNHIATALAELSESNTQVAAASEEQAVTADQISQNLIGIKDSGDRVLQSTEETAMASEGLAVQANALRTLMSAFQVRTECAS